MRCLAFLVIRNTCCLKICKNFPTSNKSPSAAWDYSKKKGADTSIRGCVVLIGILDTLGLRRKTEVAFRRQPLRKSQPGSFRCPTTLHLLQYSQALSYSAPHYNQ
ncbi:hypothetical protein J6590_099171 [Homalodisca vitripennis]|nr:hypothetical protein J6590_099171 [Homalodisca vitripennis]